jgi:Fe-S oxidoreductase
VSGASPDRRTSVTEGCRYCWMCRHVCPVGHVTSRETLTPHAWALTIESVRRGQLAWNAETAAVMYACADCGLCRAHCATDQPLPDAIVAARGEIVQAGAAPAAVRDYRERLAGLSPAARDAGKEATRGEPAPASSPRAILCAQSSTVVPDEVAAARRLLDAAGLGAAAIGEGLDTGLTASALGLRDEAIDLARRVVAEVSASGAAEILVLTPAERWTFEHVYPARLGVAWPAGVQVLEVTTALARALEEGRLRLSRAGDATPVAYHDPCHGPRIDRDASAPRRLLDAITAAGSRRELLFRAERAHPCGAIGGLPLTHPAIARMLATARCRDAASAGAATLVTDDPTCLAHLSECADGRMKVQGLYGMLAAHLAN